MSSMRVGPTDTMRTVDASFNGSAEPAQVIVHPAVAELAHGATGCVRIWLRFSSGSIAVSGSTAHTYARSTTRNWEFLSASCCSYVPRDDNAVPARLRTEAWECADSVCIFFAGEMSY